MLQDELNPYRYWEDVCCDRLMFAEKYGNRKLCFECHRLTFAGTMHIARVDDKYMEGWRRKAREEGYEC